jgi:hypothetical protein
LGVCDLVLGLAGDETNVVARLEEVIRQLRMARVRQGAHGLVLREPNGVPPLVVALSPSSLSLSGPSEMQVRAVTLNRVWWGVRLVLTAVLSHFLELEVELDLLGFGYNADLSCDEMETLWTWTHRASESLSPWVPPSAARSPPDDAGEE